MSEGEPDKLKLLVLGLNYAPEMVGIAVYTSGMAEELANAGHDVRVVAGQPYYPQWRILPGFPSWRWTSAIENSVQIIRCPHYIPRKPSGAKRVLHHLSFAVSALVPTLFTALRQRPDVIIAIAPALIAAPVALLAALLCGARSWLHIQDFEVEAAAATGLVRDGPLLKLARSFERAVLRGFDRVSSISPKMCERLEQKGVRREKVVELRNWADTDAITPLDRPSLYRTEWAITAPHVALYSGNIANKQGIEIVVEAARLLAHRTDLTFVICGEGPNRKTLEARAEGLANIQFHDLQPRERLNELLGLATVHLLPQLAGAADLVLPSKLGNMLASGRPIIATAAPSTGLAAEVDGCGVVVEPGNADALAEAIVMMLQGSDDCTGARLRALTHWSRQAQLAKMDQLLHGLKDTRVGHQRERHDG